MALRKVSTSGIRTPVMENTSYLREVKISKIASGDYDVVALDEFTYPLAYGWLATADVVEFLKTRPARTHVIITGRDAPQELIEYADLVTEMREIKHPFQQGLKAQPGIEF